MSSVSRSLTAEANLDSRCQWHACAKCLFGVKKSDAWQAFVGFDRPTWIRPLNRRTTFS